MRFTSSQLGDDELLVFGIKRVSRGGPLVLASLGLLVKRSQAGHGSLCVRFGCEILDLL